MKNIIFDFDGTLVDTAPLIIATMQAAIKELGLRPKTESECRSTIGLRLEEIPAVLWPGTPNLSAEYALTYRRIFDSLKRPLNVTCFPGVVETLDLLHTLGYRMAIASSRSHKSLEEYVDTFNLSDRFDIIIGGNDVAKGKPSPEPVLTILKMRDWNPAETVVVGDAAVDIIMGNAALCHTCGVTYGNGTVGELENANPDIIVNSFSELPCRLSTLPCQTS